jgi:hypothetical protein
VTVTGGTVALNAVASNAPTYQWFLNGATPVAGATTSTLLLPNAENSPGMYTCVATNADGSATSNAATVSVATAVDFGHLTNLSTRAMVGTNSNILIAGFAIGGTTSRTVLIRASGPALGVLGVSGTLPDPQLTLVNGTTTLAQNTGWGGSPQIASEASMVGAFSWGTAATNDSALLITLPPGTYSAEVAGAKGDTGIALVEVYEVP